MIDPKKIWSSSQLPTLPTVAARLIEISRNPEPDLRQITSLIKSDPAISIKVLKAANSTFAGLSARVTSVDHAVPLLGATMVTSLALSFTLVDAAAARGVMASHYNRYWLQSLVHAASAESLAARFGSGQAGEHLLAGLLIDVGRLALLKTFPGPYCQVLERWEQQPELPLHQVENELLGVDHRFVGSELMRIWNLPNAMQACARLHHAPVAELCKLPPSPDSRLVQSAAVAAAIGDYYCTTAKGRALERLRELTRELLGCDEESLRTELTQMKARIHAAGELFSIPTVALPEPGELMAQANEQLSQLAMRVHVQGAQAQERQKATEQQHRELQARNAELLQKALHDPLTKVYNRAFLDEALSQEVQRCCRAAESVGVIFVDVDKFKSLNDTHGHPFGDLVLKRVAECMAASIRACDTLARYGGEEFVILVSNPTEKGIAKLAERIRARLEAEDIRSGDQRVPVTASFGAALTIPGRNDKDAGPRIVAAADEAMYDAKHSGRNCVRVKSVLKEADRQLLHLVTQRRFSRWIVSRGLLDIDAVSKVVVQCEPQRLKTGELAQKLGLLNASQVEQILREQNASELRFGELAMSLGHLGELDLANVLAIKQENPHDLAERLAACGAISKSRAGELVEEYLAECCPALVGA